MKQLSQESSDSLKISETRHGLGKRGGIHNICDSQTAGSYEVKFPWRVTFES